MLYRRLLPSDLEAAQRFCIEGLRPRLYPLWVDPSKVGGVLGHFINSDSDFHLAAFDEQGQIVGGIAAVVSEMLWFERCEATVVMFRAAVPGVGDQLLGALKVWADRNMRVRRIQLPCEFDAKPAMRRYLAMRGFTWPQTMAVLYKG